MLWEQLLDWATSHVANNMCCAVYVGRCLCGCTLWLLLMCVYECVRMCMCARSCLAKLRPRPTHAADFVNACVRIKRLAVRRHTWLVKGSSKWQLGWRLLDRWTFFFRLNAANTAGVQCVWLGFVSAVVQNGLRNWVRSWAGFFFHFASPLFLLSAASVLCSAFDY